MDLNPIQPTTANSNAVTPPPTSDADTSVIDSDFETFLVMLTAQIQNQDPLNPIDSSDYAVQLATFSSVEQQTLTNEYLREMSTNTGTASLADLATWVGLEAEVDGPLVYSGSPIAMTVNVPAEAETSVLKISDGSRVVASFPLDPGTNRFYWDGELPGGQTASHGTYTASLETYPGGGAPVERSAVPTFQPITEIRQGQAGAEVVFSNGRIVSSAEVTGLKQPTES